jgi:hypothetical protein
LPTTRPPDSGLPELASTHEKPPVPVAFEFGPCVMRLAPRVDFDMTRQRGMDCYDTS